MSDKTLEGTVALVTGASSGIGEAAARELAGLGSSVAILARRADRLESLAEEFARRRCRGARDRGRRHRSGGGRGRGRAGRVRARPARRPRQQRRGDAPRADRGRPARGVGARLCGSVNVLGAPLLRQGGAPAPAEGGRRRPARLRGPGQHLIRGRPAGERRQRRLQRDPSTPSAPSAKGCAKRRPSSTSAFP